MLVYYNFAIDIHLYLLEVHSYVAFSAISLPFPNEVNTLSLALLLWI